MAITSFSVDAKTEQTLENVMCHSQADSTAEVLRKAIALLNVASRSEQVYGILIIRHQNGQDLKVLVR